MALRRAALSAQPDRLHRAQRELTFASSVVDAPPRANRCILNSCVLLAAVSCCRRVRSSQVQRVLEKSIGSTDERLLPVLRFVCCCCGVGCASENTALACSSLVPPLAVVVLAVRMQPLPAHAPLVCLPVLSAAPVALVGGAAQLQQFRERLEREMKELKLPEQFRVRASH